MSLFQQVVNIPLVAGLTMLIGSVLPYPVGLSISCTVIGLVVIHMGLRTVQVIKPSIMVNPNNRQKRLAGELDGDFVVFLIGARSNNLVKLTQVFKFMGDSMQSMQSELQNNKSLGCLHIENFIGQSSDTMSVQYWRSAEHLRTYARSKLYKHFDPWLKMMKIGKQTSDYGIWHETYLVTNNNYEAIYVNMPEFGLGKAGKLVSASGRNRSMATRLNLNVPDQQVDVPEGMDPPEY